MPIKKVGKGNQTKILTQSLRRAQKSSIEVGHFQSDGKHSSGLSYVDIMALWAFGGPNQDSIKNPRAILSIKMQELSTKPEFKSAMRRWLSQANPSDSQFMNNLGSFILEQYKELFGVTFPSLMQGSPSNRNSPLLDTGELKNKASYKIKQSGG